MSNTTITQFHTILFAVKSKKSIQIQKIILAPYTDDLE